jgi:acetyl-CoA carboxylase carboxyltransferase component
MAMAAGGLHAPLATASWPSGEFGAMGLEGAVELGFRKELDAAVAGPEREALRQRLVAAQYAKGKAINMAATLEIDAVIDPADTRRWLLMTLACAKTVEPGGRFIDPW